MINSDSIFGFGFAIFVILFWLYVFNIGYKEGLENCPKCKQANLIASITAELNTNTTKKIEMKVDENDK